jgi:hypothetical protein
MSSGPLDKKDDLVSVSRSRLQELEARAELDAQNFQLLQEHVKKLEGALAREEARGEQLATAFAEVARTCDNRARDLEAQYAATLAKLEFAHDAVVAAKDAAKDAALVATERRFAELESSHARTVAAKEAAAADLRAALANLERDNAALRADAAAQLAAIHTAVTSKLAPSSMFLDAWKREYSNNDTRTKAAPWLFENLDSTGYSAYWCRYKYNSDLKMPFITAGLISGWFQRMAGTRKNAFGCVLIVGEEGNHEIRGFWIFRGQPPLPECVLDVDDTELFEWTHIPDVKAEKEAITDYLCWEGPTIDKPVMEGRTFK